MRGHFTHNNEKYILSITDIDIESQAKKIDCGTYSHSAYVSHFNALELRNKLTEYNIKYLYLGKELGPRSDNPQHYINGKVQYHLLEQSQHFKSGIQKLVSGIQHFTIAIMCAEKDPINCHRSILICKHLPKEINIFHILGDSSLEAHSDLEKRLVITHFGDTATLFNTYDELLKQAYLLQAQKIAYTKEEEK
ncbi:MAG: DUF488 domain-containing protein [Spirochaetes bacterium]|nr:DUF488 domain-containing protein [Spirochaetota bacterium]